MARIVATDGSAVGASPGKPGSGVRGWGWYANDGTYAYGHCDDDPERAATAHALQDVAPGHPIVLVTDYEQVYWLVTGDQRARSLTGPSWRDVATAAVARNVKIELRNGRLVPRRPEQAVAHWLAFLGRERIDRANPGVDIAGILAADKPMVFAHALVRKTLKVWDGDGGLDTGRWV